MTQKQSEASRVLVDTLKQFNVLHIDQSAFSRKTFSNFLTRYYFVISRNHSLDNPNAILPELKRESYNCLIINYATCHYDFCLLLRKIKKQYPGIITIIYNFSHSTFEKKHLLKAGLNALFPVHFSVEDMLCVMQDITPDSTFLNDLVTPDIMNKVKKNIIENFYSLTPKEILFIRSACNGLSHKEIGEKYFTSKQRVDNVFHEIRVKTGCETPIDFLRYAIMNKIIDWTDNFTV